MGTMRDRSDISWGQPGAFSLPAFVPAVAALAMMAFAWQLAASSQSFGTAENSASAGAVNNSSPIPVGTVLPVRLDDTVSIKEAHPGQTIEAKIMQDVPLPSHKKIPKRSSVNGSILTVVKDNDGEGVKVTLRFVQIDDHKQILPVVTSLRAVASFNAVRTAQLPFTDVDSGTPNGWADTTQIGGDIRYGDGGEVRNVAKQKVGKGVTGGVLVHLSANPGLGCDGPVSGDDPLQALWVFSADACGVYDLKGLQISHNGKSAPLGEITLHFNKVDTKIEAGTGILLRVLAKP